jgi:uroporphyrinogen-III synthase
MAERPLAGLNIVVTRPRPQAAGLAGRIEAAGGKPLLFPLLEIEPVSDVQALREQLSHLEETDLAIFISPNAVRYGVAAIQSLCARGGVEKALPATVQIAAVGQGSAKALHELGIENVLAPTERFDSEGLLALGEMNEVAGKRVMILRGDGGRELLGDTLRARGANVAYVTCYLRSKPDLHVAELLAAAPDAVTVTSSEALNYLWEVIEEAGRARLAAIPLFVPHDRIAHAARRLGWQHVTATESGDDGLLSGLIAWAQSKRN